MTTENEGLSYRIFVQNEVPRMLFEGALNVDIERVFSIVELEYDWVREWKRLGEKEENKAQVAEENGFIKTAFYTFVRASNYHRLAQYHLLEDIPRKRELLKKSVLLYHKAISLDERKIIPLEVPFKERKVKGYLHLPKNAKEPTPCVICIPGLGHNKESMHSWCVNGADRGVAVFIGDGPGYGETRVLDNITFTFKEFDLYVKNTIALLSNYTGIDSRKIGILGDCFGGYLAYRAARENHLLKACAIIEGILAFGEYQLKGKPMPQLVTYHVDKNEIGLLEKIYSDFFDKESEMTCPVYLLHAKTDNLIPVEIAKKIYEEVVRKNKNSHIEIVEDEVIYKNYLVNHYNSVLDDLSRYIPIVWDWMVKSLHE
jgi:dienelactone hydrolase